MSDRLPTLHEVAGKGWPKGFWLRLRGSYLHETGRNEDGTDFRLILRYETPAI